VTQGCRVGCRSRGGCLGFGVWGLSLDFRIWGSGLVKGSGFLTMDFG
jgi:hypothetical protein